MIKKFKVFSKLKLNILDHPKIKYKQFKRKKWLDIDKRIPRSRNKYGNLLRAKQILKIYYGNPTEKILIKFYKEAKRIKGNSGLNFLKLLEKRLNTVLFRARFSNSFEDINQLITHKHICVNGKPIKSPAYLLKEGDIISVNINSFDFIHKKVLETFKSRFNFKSNKEIRKKNIETFIKKDILSFSPNYIEVNYNTLETIFIDTPNLKDIIYPNRMNISYVMQYYEYIKKI